MKITTGMLDRKITLQSRSTTRLAGGSLQESWTDDANVWAHLAKLDGEESMDGPEVRHLADAVFVIRSRAVAAGDTRVKYRGDIYEVQGAVELQLDERFSRYRFLKLTCNHIES